MKRYSQFSKIFKSQDGVKFLSGLPFMDYLYSGRVVYHKVTETEEDRLDLIAYKYFGDPTLWYPIALYNSMRDPIIIPIGTELAIPIDAVTASQYVPCTYLNANQL